ncbi:[LSU ribosomal protein L3P]-glutamine N5-methyltransferase [Nitrobacter winogradskyi Nb-255]|uniref:[LSU ribosomal protein L3P]-glutamine N5-methyltransferase n=1 Tax=Nitrobacter winogradskyi (strain ATCC 25391 / DSM 10237 / CIP 104748 / NCIMB 11846 / Nb-255) TaxID=323098 RepID=Q3SPL6_NITWN|nr:50S ribosomal protein L3 N(5)-glutamine methyltransferase [Nitrobacter winogradskyi]ABA05775.1 [LSU ribosomal protein L3P]-glutamine N5-methyltransferase [Nitrobacter winogradskyi Nb-255]
MAKTAARGGRSKAATSGSGRKRPTARVAAKAANSAVAGTSAPELETIFDYVRHAADRLQRAHVIFAHGTTDPVAEAAFLVGEAMQLHPDEVEPQATLRVPKAAGRRILAWIEQRIATRKPAAYLVNRMYMRGLPFYVDERVIVPRSFIGEILDSHFGGDDVLCLRDPATLTRVLDLCTGSGCLAILAARAFPNATVDATDLSADALAVAARNVREHGLDDRIQLAQGDLFAAVRGRRYDLIISNPPYVDAEGMAGLPRECLVEPRMAFDGGTEGIDLVRRIIDRAETHLAPGGGLLCEVGRCKPAIEKAYPRADLLWLDTEESEGEVFWIDAAGLDGLSA